MILFAGGKLVFNWSGARKCDSGVRGDTEKNQVQHEHMHAMEAAGNR